MAVDTASRDRLWKSLEDLARFGAAPSGGVNRVSYTPEHRAAIEWLKGQMESAGLATRLDGAGNLIGRWEGAQPGPAIALGSHSDSVPNGGRFDGAYGVMGALEALRLLREEGFVPKKPIEMLVFAEEEGARTHIILLGSKAMAGLLDRQLLEKGADYRGIPLPRVLEEFGTSVDSFMAAARPMGEIGAFVELHIEQGGMLDREGIPLGMVGHIAGIRHEMIRFVGETNHAGSTPMHLRHDALLAAARLVVGVRRLVQEHGGPNTVGTVGLLHPSPNVINIVAGEATAGVDLRGVDKGLIDRLAGLVRQEAEAAGAEESISVGYQTISDIPPVHSDERILALAQEACERLGFPWRPMVSGPLHDACSLSTMAPVGMIFVPSVGGRSHCPEEYTSPDDLWRGAKVLSEVVKGLAS